MKINRFDAITNWRIPLESKFFFFFRIKIQIAIRCRFICEWQRINRVDLWKWRNEWVAMTSIQVASHERWMKLSTKRLRINGHNLWNNDIINNGCFEIQNGQLSNGTFVGIVVMEQWDGENQWRRRRPKQLTISITTIWYNSLNRHATTETNQSPGKWQAIINDLAARWNQDINSIKMLNTINSKSFDWNLHIDSTMRYRSTIASPAGSFNQFGELLLLSNGMIDRSFESIDDWSK